MLSAIAAAFASGLAGGLAQRALTKRNPRRGRKANKNRKATAPKRKDPPGLATAKRLAARFHGDWRGHVIELSPAERQVSKFVVAAGDLKEFTYSPRKGSKRARYDWRHESLDRGLMKAKGKRRPILAVDPADGKPVLVSKGAAVRFSSERGFVG